jgi:hypothetical protein
MKLFKLGLFLLLSLNLVVLTSCGDDDENCVAPAVSENIIGTWTVMGSTVEFQSDGTLIDPDGALIEVEINGEIYDQKSYVVNDNTLELTAMPSNGSGSSSADLEIAGNECNKITLSVLGFSVDMNRQ